MKNFFKFVFVVVALYFIVWVICPVNEIVIKTGETKQSVCEIEYKEYQPCELENNITISWDLKSEQSKHFSIEHFEDGDVDDAFIISYNLHVVDNGVKVYDWHTFDIEGWINVDQHWFELRIG